MKKVILVALILKTLFFVLCSFANENRGVYRNRAANELRFEDFIIDYVSIRYPYQKFKEFIYVGVERQKLFVFQENKVVKTYEISTSKYGAGSKSGSEQTPIGLHCVKSKHGHDVPVGGVFQSKKFTGKIVPIETAPIGTGRDEITTRVISLAGMEPGVNKGGVLDSYERNIYIHGTAEEGLIGKPASHGCIRMRNLEVIELFDIVKEGMPVLILNN
jgi:lipoprotein-anchoring transpeptidase ErfK/SrfK